MGLRGLPIVTNVYVATAALVLVIFSLNRIMNSRVGKSFIAIREDELAAEAMGINTTRFKILAFIIGAFYAGMAVIMMIVKPQGIISGSSLSNRIKRKKLLEKGGQ